MVTTLRAISQGAADVAEQFALEKRFDDGGAVQNRVTAGMGGTPAVNGLGNEVLARSRGSGDQQRAIMRGDPADLREQIPHERAASDDAFKFRAGEEFAFKAQAVLPAPRFVEKLADAFPQSGDRNGLVEIIRRAFFHGFDGGFGGVMRGH
jgi:hypothetical protein